MMLCYYLIDVMVAVLVLDLMAVVHLLDSDVVMEDTMMALLDIDVGLDVKLSSLTPGLAVDTDFDVESDLALTPLACNKYKSDCL